MEYFLEKQILYLMHEISCRKDIISMAKKIISETSEYIIDETTGECKLKRSCKQHYWGRRNTSSSSIKRDWSILLICLQVA